MHYLDSICPRKVVGTSLYVCDALYSQQFSFKEKFHFHEVVSHNPWVCWNTLFSFPNDKKFFSDEGAQLYWSIWGSVLKLDHNFGDFLKCIITSIGNFI
jgi:hypothetical protein